MLRRQIDMAEKTNEELFKIHETKQVKWKRELNFYKDQCDEKQAHEKEYFEEIKSLNEKYKKIQKQYNTVIEEA